MEPKSRPGERGIIVLNIIDVWVERAISLVHYKGDEDIEVVEYTHLYKLNSLGKMVVMKKHE